jgi:uncharacterized protein YkwD
MKPRSPDSSILFNLCNLRLRLGSSVAAIVLLLRFTPVLASPISDSSVEESRFAEIFNRFRAELKLPELQENQPLENAARGHSEWMAGIDFLSHFGPIHRLTPYQRIRLQGYGNYTFAGENIACGNESGLKTFLQLANSPHHLKNMIHPHYHEMGIARSGTGLERCPYYWTHDFGSMTDPTLDPALTPDASTIDAAVFTITGQHLDHHETLKP